MSGKEDRIGVGILGAAAIAKKNARGISLARIGLGECLAEDVLVAKVSFHPCCFLFTSVDCFFLEVIGKIFTVGHEGAPYTSNIRQ